MSSPEETMEMIAGMMEKPDEVDDTNDTSEDVDTDSEEVVDEEPVEPTDDADSDGQDEATEDSDTDGSDDWVEDDRDTLVAELEGLRKELQELREASRSGQDESQPEEVSIKQFALDPEKLAALREKHGEVVDSLVVPMAQQLNTAMQAIQQIQSDQQEAAQAQQIAQDTANFKWANSQLDELQSSFPGLRDSSKLHYLSDGSPNMKDPGHQVRAAIYDRADALFRAGVCSTFNEAFQDALSWYKGSQAEEEVQRNVVKDLKKRERRISGRPSKKNTEPAKLEGDAAKRQFMDQIFKDAGIKK